MGHQKAALSEARLRLAPSFPPISTVELEGSRKAIAVHLASFVLGKMANANAPNACSWAALIGINPPCEQRDQIIMRAESCGAANDGRIGEEASSEALCSAAASPTVIGQGRSRVLGEYPLCRCGRVGE